MWNPFKKLQKTERVDMNDFTKSNIDNIISEYLACSSEQRQIMRDSFKKENSGNYLSQSHQFSVDAVRGNNYELVKKGLILHSIENARVDWRDNLVGLALLYNSARKLGKNADELFSEIANLSDNNMKELLINYTKRKESLKSLECMGYKEIEEPQFDYVQLSSI